ncbi:hypothetical protein HZS_5098 [Henneguya salminicola]|nr:hypothetical protein HZS_5098 [Henneguya salminicola]
MNLKIVLGCMEFGRRLSFDHSKPVICDFLTKYKELDTAFMYADGDSEKLLGITKNTILQLDGLISTKINPNNDGYLPEIFEQRAIRHGFHRHPLPTLALP